MSADVAEIQAKLQQLTQEERIEVLRGLLADLDGPPDPEIERAWLVEAQRRHKEVIEGKVTPIPAAEVFRKIRSRLKH